MVIWEQDIKPLQYNPPLKVIICPAELGIEDKPKNDVTRQ